MKGTPAVYLGRIVEKEHFRVFVHGANGERKLVNSWDEYEAAMESGLWFATKDNAEEINAPVEIFKGDTKPKPKPKPRSVKFDKLDDMVFEVKDGE